MIVSDGTTSTQVITRTVVNSPTQTPTLNPTSGETTTSITGTPDPSAAALDTPTSPQLSTASIVGIALGSVAAAILLVICLLFALGFRIRFRIQREKWQRHSTPTKTTELQDEDRVTAFIPGSQHVKAELEDTEYTRRLERLQDGAKPELEGSRPRKSVWKVFSIRSVKKQGPRQVNAKLGSDPMASGPHELQGEGILQPSNEVP